jgi:hypothetical protein
VDKLYERLSGRKAPLLQRRPSGRLVKADTLMSGLHNQTYVTIRQCQTWRFSESGDFWQLSQTGCRIYRFTIMPRRRPGLPHYRSTGNKY